jgi:hypothetical protein
MLRPYQKCVSTSVLSLLTFVNAYFFICFLFYHSGLSMSVFHSLTDLRVSYKKQELFTLRQHMMLLPGFWWVPCCSIFLVFCFFALFAFFLCLVCPMLPVSLDCPFLIAPLVFSHVYLYWLSIYVCIQGLIKLHKLVLIVNDLHTFSNRLFRFLFIIPPSTMSVRPSVRPSVDKSYLVR